MNQIVHHQQLLWPLQHSSTSRIKLQEETLNLRKNFLSLSLCHSPKRQFLLDQISTSLSDSMQSLRIKLLRAKHSLTETCQKALTIIPLKSCRSIVFQVILSTRDKAFKMTFSRGHKCPLEEVKTAFKSTQNTVMELCSLIKTSMHSVATRILAILRKAIQVTCVKLNFLIEPSHSEIRQRVARALTAVATPAIRLKRMVRLEILNTAQRYCLKRRTVSSYHALRVSNTLAKGETRSMSVVV